MSDAYSPSNPSDPQTGFESPSQTGSSGKCLLYGCLGVFVAGLLMIVLAGFGVYFAVQRQVEAYTSNAPMELPTVEYSDEDLQALESKIETFRKTLATEDVETTDGGKADGDAEADVEAGESATDGEAESAQPDAPQPAPPRELVLTADDINALVAKEEKLAGRVFFEITDGKLTGDISVPVDSFVPGSKGRYFNGSGTFDVSLDEGVLMVRLDQAELKGEPLPEALMGELRKQNLAKDVYKDQRNAEMIGRFDQIRIEGDKIIATLKDP